ncbi:uncharacterized protein LOC118511470 [Anopheles stephensi]|uniref:uncharacterized protein LOC118511470 n=1 Tax=Anopheles stephensi TaxID=30069 RepID=UPI0016588A51|nr:uncharacterized protein LOC118511470 [Anopheles stephensi]XP_035910483.1 uncharacterized protein LOC118511470 [Anopheles stephensi]XP_035910484.1 uncharacterized protein LOC118511470 [Anopheles stephensi]
MVLSVLMVQTLTTLLEPPPAIGGTKGLPSTGQPHQPQANIAVFMFLFMLCAAEVVFIKLLTLTSFGRGDVLTTAATASTNATSTTATQTSTISDQSPDNLVQDATSSTNQE